MTVDPRTGSLTLIGTVPLEGEPIQIVTDRTGRGIEQVRARQRQHRPQALAAAESAVAHGFAQPRRTAVGQSEAVFEHPVHPYTRGLADAFPVIGDDAFRMNPSGLPGDPPDPRQRHRHDREPRAHGAEDRQRRGLVLDFSLAENIALHDYDREVPVIVVAPGAPRHRVEDLATTERQLPARVPHHETVALNTILVDLARSHREVDALDGVGGGVDRGVGGRGDAHGGRGTLSSRSVPSRNRSTPICPRP